MTVWLSNLDTVDSILPLVSTLLFKHGVTQLVLAAAASCSIDSFALGTAPHTTQSRLPEINQH